MDKALPDTGPVSAVERTRWTTVATSALATLMVASELSMAAFALPHIGAELGVTSATTAWVLLAYQLPLAALALPTGRWVDRADLRLVFMLSLGCVAVASALAGLAPVFWALMVARVLQGAAAALYMAVYLPVISSSVRADQHGRAMSYHATIMMVGSMAVAPLGGWLAEALGWRAVFLVKVPLLLPVIVLGAVAFARVHAGGRRLPVPGRGLALEVLLVGGAVTVVLLAGEQIERSLPLAAGLVVAATALVAGWARLPASKSVIALARRPAFALPALALMLNAATIGLITFLLPFSITDVLGSGLEVLGVAIVFLVAAGAVVSPLAGVLTDRYGPVRVARAGAALTVAAMLPMLTLEPGVGLIDLGWRLALLGAGMALFNSPNMTAILQATPGEAGTAGGLTNITRTLGSTLGPAAAALAWSAAAGGVSGFRGGVITLTVFTVVAFLALCAVRKTGS